MRGRSYLEGGKAEDGPLRVLMAEGRDLHGHGAVCGTLIRGRVCV